MKQKFFFKRSLKFWEAQIILRISNRMLLIQMEYYTAVKRDALSSTAVTKMHEKSTET